MPSTIGVTSQITKWFKDGREITYLDHIRQELRGQLSRCHMCGQPSTTVGAEGYRLLPVCRKHDRE